IKGRTAWLALKGQIIKNKIVVIEDVGDIYPYSNEPIFDNCEILCLNKCKDNFMYYWLHTKMFPNIKRIILNSNPGDKQVILRLKNTNIIMNKRFERYSIDI